MISLSSQFFFRHHPAARAVGAHFLNSNSIVIPQGDYSAELQARHQRVLQELNASQELAAVFDKKNQQFISENQKLHEIIKTREVSSLNNYFCLTFSLSIRISE